MSSEPRIGELTPIAGMIPRKWRKQPGTNIPGLVARRLSEESLELPCKNPLYLSPVFCQICLPYKDQGEQREWFRNNGHTSVSITAGRFTHPETGERIDLGLPCGTAPRLLLMEITRQAKVNKSQTVEMGKTLSQFTRGNLRLHNNGQNKNRIREQLGRLALSRIQVTTMVAGKIAIAEGKLTNYSLWDQKAPLGKLIWPETIWLDSHFFEVLMQIDVPLHKGHIAALSHSAMALDVYCWLVYRLCQLEKPLPLSWEALWRQFGQGFDRSHMFKFRQFFRRILVEVRSVYKAARIEEPPRGLRMLIPTTDGGQIVREQERDGLMFYPSKSPIPQRTENKG